MGDWGENDRRTISKPQEAPCSDQNSLHLGPGAGKEPRKRGSPAPKSGPAAHTQVCGTLVQWEKDWRPLLFSLRAEHGIHCPSLCAKKSPLLSASKPLYLPSALKTLFQSPTRPSRPPTRYHISSLHFLCKAGAPRTHILWFTCLLPVPHRRT